MLQAAILDGDSFDPFSFQQDGLGASEVDVSRGKIAQALVIAAIVVVVDESVDLGFQVARQIIVLKQDAVLERLMPALDLVFAGGRARRARDPYCGCPAIRRGRPRCRKGHYLRAIGGDERHEPDQAPRLAAPGPAFP